MLSKLQYIFLTLPRIFALEHSEVVSQFGNLITTTASKE